MVLGAVGGGGSGVTIGDAIWNITGDATQLNQSLKESRGSVAQTGGFFQQHGKRIGVAMTAAGAATVGALGASVRSFVQVGDELDKMSERTGISVEALSELEFAASQSGVSMSDFENSIRLMTQNTQRWIDAGEDSTGTLERIGVSLQDLSDMSPEERFMALAEGISTVDNESERASAAIEIFGRSATRMLPLVNNGAEGIEELRQRARDLGIVFDTESATAAAALGDAMDELRRMVAMLWIEVGSELVPAVMSFVEWVGSAVQSTLAWADENPKLFRTLVLVVGGMGLFMKVAPALVATLKSIGIVAGAVGKILGLLHMGPPGWIALAAIGISVAAAAAIVGLRGGGGGGGGGDVVGTAQPDIGDELMARNNGIGLAGGGGNGTNINIDMSNARIRDEGDIENISRGLADHIDRAMT